MASSSGASAESFSLTNSGSEEDLVSQRKRKRMISNRESARRSRMRKQKHVDDLKAQLSQMREENSRIRAVLDISTRQYLGVETENSVLRTQAMELISRLNSLADILQFINLNCSGVDPQMMAMMVSECFANPWGSLLINQPLMASPNPIQYY